MLERNDMHQLAEFKLELSSLRVREAQAQHQLNVVNRALDAFRNYPRDVKVPLSSKQTEPLGRLAGRVTKLLPAKFSLAVSAAESLTKLAYIKVALIPILDRLQGDLKKEIAEIKKERRLVTEKIERLGK